MLIYYRFILLLVFSLFFSIQLIEAISLFGFQVGESSCEALDNKVQGVCRANQCKNDEKNFIDSKNCTGTKTLCCIKQKELKKELKKELNIAKEEYETALQKKKESLEYKTAQDQLKNNKYSACRVMELEDKQNQKIEKLNQDIKDPKVNKSQREEIQKKIKEEKLIKNNISKFDIPESERSTESQKILDCIVGKDSELEKKYEKYQDLATQNKILQSGLNALKVSEYANRTKSFQVTKHLCYGEECNYQVDNFYEEETNIFSKIIWLLTRLIPTISILILIIGGYFLITAHGEDQQIEKGKTIVFYALIGLILSYSSVIIIQLIVGLIFKAASI